MFDAITAWCERLKAERPGLSAVASDIEFMCRAHGEARHENFWDFGLDRLIELLQARFAEEERLLDYPGCEQMLEAQEKEHEHIISQLYILRQRHELNHADPEAVHLAERDLLTFLDNDLAEHVFGSDTEARRICAEAGLSFP